MAAPAASLFIDTNQYLKLYMADKGKKKLLQLLKENQQYIFITQQIVDEIQRNKLRQAKSFLNTMTQAVKQLKLPTFDSPEHLIGRSDSIAVSLYKKFVSIQEQVREIEEELQKESFQILQQISSSEDEVSKVFAELFDKVAAPSTEELQRARERKERGNPPGKPNDPLGDQISWEQLLSHSKSKSKLWIVSEDSDYSIEHRGKRFLNSLLQQDISRARQSGLEVFCFGNLLKAIEDFESKTGIKSATQLTEQESREIKEELDSLPPFGFGGSEYGVAGWGAGHWATEMIRKHVESPLDHLPSTKLKKTLDEMPEAQLKTMLDAMPGYKLKRMFDELPENQLKQLLGLK